MTDTKQKYYAKRGDLLVKNLHSRHYEAYYCETKEKALEKALELIPRGATVGWGGAMSAKQIGLLDAMNNGEYHAIDRDKTSNPEERKKAMKSCLLADVFITGANALSMTARWSILTATEIVWLPLYMVLRASLLLLE